MTIDEFKKNKKFAVCIDSDGCAVDSMTIKHEKAFSTALIETFDLFDFENEVRNKWYEYNLYSKTRGINRFIGLNLILHYINDNFKKIESLEIYDEFISTTSKFSADALEKYALDKSCELLNKCLEWSKLTNKLIKSINENEINLFEHVKESIEYMHEFADVYVVSSANLDAINNEWSRLGILQYVDVVCSQNDGTKEECIRKVLSKGYDTNSVIMFGDSPLDLESALNNKVFFYPILCKKENTSWENARFFFELFTKELYDLKQSKLIDEFNSNLK